MLPFLILISKFIPAQRKATKLLICNTRHLVSLLINITSICISWALNVKLSNCTVLGKEFTKIQTYRYLMLDVYSFCLDKFIFSLCRIIVRCQNGCFVVFFVLTENSVLCSQCPTQWESFIEWRPFCVLDADKILSPTQWRLVQDNDLLDNTLMIFNDVCSSYMYVFCIGAQQI